jgi:hypothetical protein
MMGLVTAKSAGIVACAGALRTGMSDKVTAIIAT